MRAPAAGKTLENPVKTACVLLPMPAEKPYSYAVPQGMELAPGDIVQVPLGPRQVVGVVWDGGDGGVDPKKLREVSGSSIARRSARTCGASSTGSRGYTLSPPGMVARMVLRAPGAFDPEPPIEGLRYSGQRARPDDAGARRRCWNLRATAWPGRNPALPMPPGVTASVVDGLDQAGLLRDA